MGPRFLGACLFMFSSGVLRSCKWSMTGVLLQQHQVRLLI